MTLGARFGRGVPNLGTAASNQGTRTSPPDGATAERARDGGGVSKPPTKRPAGVRRMHVPGFEPRPRVDAWSCFGYFEPTERERLFGHVRWSIGRSIATDADPWILVKRGPAAVAPFLRSDCPFVVWYWGPGETEPGSFDVLP